MQLNDFFLTRFHLDWRPPSKKTVEVNLLNSGFDYDVAIHAKNDKAFKLDLRLSISEVGKQRAEVGYLIEAQIVGLFSFESDVDRQTCEKLVRVNGVSILYSTFRGVLAGMTGLFPGGKLSLPSIMPMHVVQQVEERRLAQKQALTASSPK
jgi:preprotein translocase subunit SecB